MQKLIIEKINWCHYFHNDDVSTVLYCPYCNLQHTFIGIPNIKLGFNYATVNCIVCGYHKIIQLVLSVGDK